MGHQWFALQIVLEAVAHVCHLAGNTLQPLDRTGDYSPMFHQGSGEALVQEQAWMRGDS